MLAAVWLMRATIEAYDKSGALLSLVFVASVLFQLRVSSRISQWLGFSFSPRPFHASVSIIGAKSVLAASSVVLATWLWRAHVLGGGVQTTICNQ